MALTRHRPGAHPSCPSLPLGPLSTLTSSEANDGNTSPPDVSENTHMFLGQEVGVWLQARLDPGLCFPEGSAAQFRFSVLSLPLGRWPPPPGGRPLLARALPAPGGESGLPISGWLRGRMP